MFTNLLNNRKSVRKFNEKKISEEIQQNILNAVALAPTSRNSNGTRAILVDDSELIAKLSESKEKGSQFAITAQLLVVIVNDVSTNDVWVEDGSIAAITVQYYLESIGLSSCWIQIRNRFTADKQTSQQYVSKLLNIDNSENILCMIACGYKK